MMGFRIRNVDQLYPLPSTTYVKFTYNFWVSALWDAIMGDQTLADVVAGIFTGVTTALETVKKNLNAAWDGIKSAGEFIVDTVWEGILQTIAVSVRALSEAILAILPLFLPRATSVAPGVIKFGDTVFNLDISSSGGGLAITFGDYSISIPNILSLISPPETLSLTSDQIIGFSSAAVFSVMQTMLVNTFAFILTNLFYVETVPSVQTRLVLVAMFIGLITFLTNLATQQGNLSDRQWKAYSYYMAIFHGFTAISLISGKVQEYNNYQVQDGNFKMTLDTISTLRDTITSLKAEGLVIAGLNASITIIDLVNMDLDPVTIVDNIVASIASIFGGLMMEAFGTINGLSFKTMLLWKMPTGMDMLSHRLEKLVYYFGYIVYNFVMAVYFVMEASR